MTEDYCFNFAAGISRVYIRNTLPSLGEIRAAFEFREKPLVVCDAHTEGLARLILGAEKAPLCVLPPGESAKTWAQAEAVLSAAREAGLGRDGLFIGVGGGVVSDLTAFAASVYMRGTGLCLVPTTLLGMADAALGGKTGFDLLEIKNLVGTFYPAERIYMAMDALETLPREEWKSGMGELIKTAVLDAELFSLLTAAGRDYPPDRLGELISRAVRVKGRIVEADPKETGSGRALLNLGHTFAHALESAAGLGSLSHGEAVAWGMVRACEFGRSLGVTPRDRARDITGLIRSYGYETAAPHPMIRDMQVFYRALGGDKKKRGGKFTFVIPAAKGAVLAEADSITGPLEKIINGAYTGD
jgi:3-dehydroquinate synthase